MILDTHSGLMTYALNISALRREFPGNEPAIDHAEQRYNDARRELSAYWIAMVEQAKRDHAERVAERGRNETSLSAAAQDYGLVPHGTSTDALAPGTCRPCGVRQSILRNAAAVVAWEYRHQVDHIYHVTAWQMAAPTNGHLPA